MLKTVLTYLELDGLLRQGTPFYAGYRLRPLSGTLDEVFDALRRRRAPTSSAASSRPARRGGSGRRIDPDAAAAELGEERARIVAALGYLEQQGLVELQAAEARQRYTVLARPASEAELLDRWPSASTAARRPRPRAIAQVLALVTHDGCQVRDLVGYFGEARAEPCGHCTLCLTGRAQRAAGARAAAADRDGRRRRAIAGLRDAQPGSARRAAAAGPLPVRHHEPGDDEGEADARAAVRRARASAGSATCSTGARAG